MHACHHCGNPDRHDFRFCRWLDARADQSVRVGPTDLPCLTDAYDELQARTESRVGLTVLGMATIPIVIVLIVALAARSFAN